MILAANTGPAIAFVCTALTLFVYVECADAEALRPIVDFQVTYYPVTGQTIPEIQKSIGQNTPSKEGEYYYAGVTIWDLSSNYDLVDTADGCAVRNSQVYLNTTIHLPRLAEQRHISQGVRSEWSRFSNALKTHEMLHAKNAYRAASTLLGKISRVNTSVPCVRAKTIIQDGTDALIRNITEFDRQLDVKTQHGKSQGAFLNMGVR